jgi:ribosome-associated translation inhibitor RaiA
MTHIDQVIHPQVHLHGTVAPEAVDYAVRKLQAALHHTAVPVLGSWLTLDAAAPGNRVDAHVDVNGVRLHVHAVGATLQEATDVMQERLRARLRHTRRRPAQGPRGPEPIPETGEQGAAGGAPAGTGADPDR